jgi:hypothetical protein
VPPPRRRGHLGRVGRRRLIGRLRRDGPAAAGSKGSTPCSTITSVPFSLRRPKTRRRSSSRWCLSRAFSCASSAFCATSCAITAAGGSRLPATLPRSSTTPSPTRCRIHDSPPRGEIAPGRSGGEWTAQPARGV